MHATVAGNIASSSGGGLNVSTDLTLCNSIVANNQSITGTGPDIHLGMQAPARDGTNLIGNNAGAETAFPVGSPNAAGDLVGSPSGPLDPRLAPLGNFGGSVPTSPPRPGSPAIDAAAPGLALDQRGLPRPRGAGSDIGATELVYGSTQFAPETAETGVPVQTTFGWIFEPTATSYEIFFGLDSTALVSIGTTTASSIPAPVLLLNTTYFWQVVATVEGAPVAGAVQEFRTKTDIIVTTSADTTDPDDGEMSLRESIAVASRDPDFDRITFAADLDGDTIVLSGTELAILNHAVEIDASSLPAGITISGNDLSRIFHLQYLGKLGMLNVTLTHGRSDAYGGAIHALSGCEISAADCIIRDHLSHLGGAIYAESAFASLSFTTTPEQDSIVIGQPARCPTA